MSEIEEGGPERKEHPRDRAIEVIFVATVIAVLYVTSIYNYLVFHSFVEVFSIIIGSAVFMIAWHSRRYIGNEYLLFIGVAYLFVALLDLVHTLAYSGMGVFEGYGSNLPTQLWIGARYMESATLLVGLFLISKKVRPESIFLGYSLLTMFILLAIFYFDAFPHCYEEGTGLTPFKRISEYSICLILAAAMVVLYLKRKHFERRVLTLLMAAVALTIGAETAFTFYVGVYDLSNLIGHILKLLSFYLVYKAIVVTGLRRPYDLLFKKLKDNENKLKHRTVELQRNMARLQRETGRRKAATERAMGEKNRAKLYLDVMGHDIGNMNMAIKSYTEMALRQNGLPDKAGSYLRKSGERSDGISDLIMKVRKLSDLKKGAFPLEKLDAGYYLASSIETVRSSYPEKKVNIGSTVGDAKVEVISNILLEDVFVNILGNAVKYDRHDEVVIDVIHNSDETGRFWKFQFRDRGPGITDTMKKAIFSRFSRGEEDVGGSGLGLSIVKEVVHRSGGKVWVEDRVKGKREKGSNFIILLPKC